MTEVKKEKVVKEEVKKEYFTIKIEAQVPVVVSYKILAETPEEALELAKKLGGRQLSCPTIISYHRMKLLKATIYNTGTLMIRLVKSFI